MKRRITAFICFLSMGILILDTKTALLGAAEGIELCIRTVIPSLFPFIVISQLLTTSLLGENLPILRPIGKLLRLPQGAESIWLTGSLGGYPVGAQCIGKATKSGILPHQDGKRMLCFCANAGPSFIFGIGMGVLGDIRLCFVIWLIHILSSILVGILTPGKASRVAKLQPVPPMTLPQAIPSATVTMGMISGWIILFRIVIKLLQKWVLWVLPDTAQILILGLLELSNGCVALVSIENMAHRFILFSVFLGFGGCCVAMQTASVSEDFRWYLPAKMAHGACSVIISSVAAGLLLPHDVPIHPAYLMICGVYLTCYSLLLQKFRKIALAFSPKVMYNSTNLHTR